ncbi:MAG: hypothetical protein RSA84_21270 [Acinetobacter sp.]
MKEPQVFAGDMTESELREWLKNKAAQAGGLDSLHLDVIQFENNVIPHIELFVEKLKSRINGLTSTEVCRMEDSASRAAEEAKILSSIERSFSAMLETFRTYLVR